MKLKSTIKLSALASILLFVVIFVSGCQTQVVNTWTGVYYPDKNIRLDESMKTISPIFNTLIECKAWAKLQVKPDDDYDYECGKNCHTENGSELVCEDLIQVGEG